MFEDQDFKAQGVRGMLFLMSSRLFLQHTFASIYRFLVTERDKRRSKTSRKREEQKTSRDKKFLLSNLDPSKESDKETQIFLDKIRIQHCHFSLCCNSFVLCLRSSFISSIVMVVNTGRLRSFRCARVSPESCCMHSRLFWHAFLIWIPPRKKKQVL